MKKLIILSGILVFLLACNKKTAGSAEDVVAATKSDNLSQLNWLVGAWQNSTEGSISKENWRKVNDTLYVAESFTIVEQDTVFFETVELFQSKEDVFFSVTNALQNDGETVTFTLVPSKQGHFVFENKLHDFPTQITYSNPAKDSIHAWISGLVDGNTEKVDFYFERAN